MKEQRQSDEALMLLYQQGNQAAFETLYTRYKDMLYRYCVKHCSDTHQSEELYQDVWIKLINSAFRYQPTAKFRTYIFTIAHNTLVDFYRKNKTSESLDAENEHVAEEALQNTVPLSLPEDEFTLKQKTKRMMQALKDLPANQKEVILLHLEQDLGINEIAIITKVNYETAKSRLRYAKNKLKSAIQS